LNSGGQIGDVATGLAPRKACSPSEQAIHLGGGDITKVSAGAGLTGGGDNGAVSLGLDPGFQLPQGCADGQAPEQNGGVWTCASTSRRSGARPSPSCRATGMPPGARSTSGGGLGPLARGLETSAPPDRVERGIVLLDRAVLDTAEDADEREQGQADQHCCDEHGANQRHHRHCSEERQDRHECAHGSHSHLLSLDLKTKPQRRV
jgi:hypothetical protein